ncbi:50S ribosomal protein L15 [Candidatus Omnitrophota bacterium]
MLGLNNLRAPRGVHKRKKIVGRGSGSGHGKTSCRGSKGQGSRSGRDFYPGFEGGHTPLIRRIPKRGFRMRRPREYQIVNLGDLKRIKSDLINPEVMEKNRLIKDKDKPVKILGKGTIDKPVTVEGFSLSAAAKQKIEQAGGKCSQR